MLAYSMQLTVRLILRYLPVCAGGAILSTPICRLLRCKAVRTVIEIKRTPV